MRDLKSQFYRVEEEDVSSIQAHDAKIKDSQQSTVQDKQHFVKTLSQGDLNRKFDRKHVVKIEIQIVKY